MTLKVTGLDDLSTHPLLVGDHVRLGDSFESEIIEITDENDSLSVQISDTFIPPSASSESEEDTVETTPVPLAIKRENGRLANPPALTIAFNIARLHEAAGNTIAAIELHKAILKRNPAYVSSYLRLACIARDCGSLIECSKWLKIACKVAPGNPEVLTLVGNLHLSLCDWAPAQSVFDQLLTQKVPNVDAYSKLSLGNIYFANLKTVPKKYAKHLQRAADFYKSILTKDTANAYAANGIGTVLAEKGELFKAKEIFNRVREVSGDTIADAHLNLGHIFLAQKKHPEALRMYQSYMQRTQDGSAPITTKSRDDDVVEVLLYIAFAYFDWARQTELFNNANAAPADERYRKCIEHLDVAFAKSKRKDVIIQYNICMTKLQAANCVLQKLTRNIRRTSQEVQEALDGLEESLPQIQEVLRWKTEGKKVPLSTSMLQDFITHCKANIESAKSHLAEEKRREKEAQDILELQRLEAESQQRAEAIRLDLQKAEDEERQAERDRKAEARMKKVEELRVAWEEELEAKRAAAEKKDRKSGQHAPLVEEDGLFDDQLPADSTKALFEDSDDDDDGDEVGEDGGEITDEPSKDVSTVGEAAQDGGVAGPTEKELFGDSSSDESGDELVPSGTKRANESSEPDADGPATKKRRVFEESD
jgi:RNA polymerase-associated protein CTR9